MRLSVSIPFTATLLALHALVQSPPNPPVTNGGPKPSPDGNYIAFGSNRTGTLEAFVMRADGSGVVQVSPGGPGNKFPVGWTSDGRVLYSASTKDTARVFAVSRSGGEARQVAGGLGRGPVPSPDGAWLVTSVGNYQSARLTIATSDGRDPHSITGAEAAAFNPAWSPDGKQLAYSRLDTTGGISVWIVGVDGSQARQLTLFTEAEGRAQLPAWSGDGRRIAFQAGSLDPADSTKHLGHIWVMDLGTGALTRLAPHTEAYLDETPSWFPDGKRIAFQSNRSGRMEVWVMNADGSEARQLTGR